MKLETSRLLTRLSEQERDKVEAELAELNGRKVKLEQLYRSSQVQVKQLGKQRDQAMRHHHAASLLQQFDTAVQEEMNRIDMLRSGIAAMEQEKEAILHKLAEALRTHHAYDNLHQKAVRQQSRSADLKAQRQMDDTTATRSASGELR